MNELRHQIFIPLTAVFIVVNRSLDMFQDPRKGEGENGDWDKLTTQICCKVRQTM